MKDRLVELLLKCDKENEVLDCVNERPKARQSAEIIADYLLANGVVALPCKVGDTVWFNTFKKNATVCVGVQPHTIDRIDVSFVCDTKNLIETKIPDWEIGKTAFLTKEKAEKALEGANDDR